MTYIPQDLRQQISQNAQDRCEYCHIHEQYVLKRHEVDHIYAEKHGGETIEDNLCLSCFDCNRYKGSDLCSIDGLSGGLVELYHPRNQRWQDHFQLLPNGFIEPLTPQGRVTVRLLQINSPERIKERHRLMGLGRYP